jgi:small-conductance mechanosensitive channel
MSPERRSPEYWRQKRWNKPSKIKSPIEVKVPNRFRVTAAPCIKAVRIPEEADPRTEHSRDPGCFAGEMVNPEEIMNGLIYIVGLIVVIMFILSFLGLR